MKVMATAMVVLGLLVSQVFAGSTNFVATAVASGSTASTTIVQSPSGSWRFLMIQPKGASRIAFNSQATMNSPAYAADYTFIFQNPDGVNSVGVRSQSGSTITVNVHGVW